MICVILSRGDFWVGKQSLRGWKKMALEEIDDEIDDKEKIEKEGSENGEKPKPEENKLETVKNEADSTGMFVTLNICILPKKLIKYSLGSFFKKMMQKGGFLFLFL